MKIFYQTFSITNKLISILLLFLLAQSCTKDANCGDQSDIVNSYYISADDKSKIPFKGNDTLTYISDAGDTALLFGSGKREFIDQIRKNISGNADCPRSTVDNNETISIEYNGNNNELNNVKYKIVASQDKTRLIYTINNYMGSLTPYYFNEVSFYTSDVMINNKNYKGRQINLLDSVNLIYNKDFSFLKIEFIGGKIWLLKI
jgi:hypothetical protein